VKDKIHARKVKTREEVRIQMSTHRTRGKTKSQKQAKSKTIQSGDAE
jgi:hypothetical protein